MKWILVIIISQLVCRAIAEEQTVASAMAEMEKFAAAYIVICAEKKDSAATNDYFSLQKANPKAATLVADYWYAKAVKSNPEKWDAIARLTDGEATKRQADAFLVRYYWDHIAEIKSTVDMLLVMTK